MKKLLLLGLVLITTLLSGCNIIGIVELSNALTNMDTLDSFTMTITMEADEFDTPIQSIVKLAGNKQYATLLGMDMYSIEIDGTLYELNYQMNTYFLKELIALDTDEYDEFELYLELDFEKEDGYYIIQSDLEDLEVDEMKLKVDGDYISEMVIITTVEGIEITSTVLYSDFDETEIDFPNYAPLETQGRLDSYDTYFNVYHVDFSFNNFFVSTEHFTIDCSIINQTCNIDMSTQWFMYHLEYQTVVDEFTPEGTYIPYLEYAEANENVDEILFLYIDFLNEIYTEYSKYAD